MPTNPKVARCVQHIMKGGKDKVAAIRICQDSTGLSYHPAQKRKKRPTTNQQWWRLLNNADGERMCWGRPCGEKKVKPLSPTQRRLAARGEKQKVYRARQEEQLKQKKEKRLKEREQEESKKQADFQKLFKKDYGTRADGTKKGPGFFGELKRPDGDFSTEISIGVEFDGQETEIPTLVPTLTREEVDYLLDDNDPTEEIIDKAVAHALDRFKQKKSAFIQPGEKYVAKPKASPKKPSKSKKSSITKNSVWNGFCSLDN